MRGAATNKDPCVHKHSDVNTCWSCCTLGCEVDVALYAV